MIADSVLRREQRVSVPYGDRVYLNTAAGDGPAYPIRVSVPYGDRVYLNSIPHSGFRSGRNSFRPLWGPCLSQCNDMSVTFRHAVFPSPMGTVSISIAINVGNISACGCFRPLWGPCLSQCNVEIRNFILTLVSVPYGDRVYLNQNLPVDHKRNPLFPSPMGTVSISIRNAEIRSFVLTLFPSPMGTVSISIGTICLIMRWLKRFRPLWGPCLSQSKPQCSGRVFRRFPSPMGTVSISMRGSGSLTRNSSGMSFRPLWGPCLSQCLRLGDV